jgi:N-acetylglucosaminyldiphosphoundecaprenol N-acetyl-beta-D-mannosaminyltransferase
MLNCGAANSTWNSDWSTKVTGADGKQMKILNCNFDAVTYSETLAWAKQRLESDKRGYICTVNVAILMMMQHNRNLQDFVDRAALTVADGQPLIWLSRLIRKRLPERVAGVDLVRGLCESAVEADASVYFMGATAEVVRDVVKKMRENVQGLKVAGFDDGYFAESQGSERATRIRESGADLLIVAMGVPRQENFISNHWDELGVKLAIPVGGSFDVIAGRKKRAPAWMQKTGVEWFFRMCQEPRRLFMRYLVTNTQFIWQAFCECCKSLVLRPQ